MKVSVRQSRAGTLTVWCGLLLGLHVVAGAAAVRAGGPGASINQLSRHADQLAASDEVLRERAVAALSQLGPESLPALRQRLAARTETRPTPEEALRVLTSFRHAGGSRRADDDAVDLAAGVLPTLARERSPAVLAVAEPLLLLRALEAMDDSEAQLLLASYVRLDGGAWESELRRVRKRQENRLLPAWISLRSHDEPSVRRFAQASVAALGMEEPATALALPDPHLRAALIRAYASPPDYAAMPLITRLVGDPRVQVRAAARAAVARYGKNAIWQVRELYEELTGQAANKSWSFERSTSELYTVLDRAELEEAQTLLGRGMQNYAAGDLAGMQRAFDLLLTKYPAFEEREKLGVGYAALGEAQLALGKLGPALDAYRRALRLSPANPSAHDWQAQLEFIGAELSLTRGIVDLDGYARALALQPAHSDARRAHQRLSGEYNARVRYHKRLAAGAALGLLLLVLVLVLVLRARAAGASTPTPSEAANQAH